jgi:hypothetical protein
MTHQIMTRMRKVRRMRVMMITPAHLMTLMSLMSVRGEVQEGATTQEQPLVATVMEMTMIATASMSFRAMMGNVVMPLGYVLCPTAGCWSG